MNSSLVKITCLACCLFCVNVRGTEIEGFTEPYRQIDVAAGEPGLFIDIPVVEGQAVEKGAVLASLDVDVLKATLKIAQEKAQSSGGIAAAKAEMDLRNGRLNQLQTLRKRGHATDNEFRRAVADVKIAEARLQLAQEEARLHELECTRIKAQLQRRLIRSPIDGVVTDIHKEIGEAFLANDPRVVTVVQLDTLRAKFSGRPSSLAGFSVGETIQVRFPEVDTSTNAKIEAISPVIDAKSGTVQISILIPNSKQEFRSGSRCLLTVDEDRKSGQPIAAAGARR